jgi:prevent-host-death family protein
VVRRDVTRSVPVVQAKASFSALLAEVEAGAEVRITRRGRTVARLVPEAAISAASLFEPFWRGDSPEIEAPDDAPPEAVAVID